MIKKKSGVISHPIKYASFVQTQNRFGFSKYSLGDARCIDNMKTDGITSE